MVETTSSRWAQWVRTLVSPPAQAQVPYGSSAALNAQFWLGQFPWRPTAAWSVLAALLAVGVIARPRAIDWQTVALIVLLVDPLWGSIWRLAGGRKELLILDRRAMNYRLWLPYLQANSPAQKLLGWDETGVMPLLFRVALPTLLLSAAVATVLGPVALGMTGLVALFSVLGWTSRRALAVAPVLLQSIVTIALPWLLTAYLLKGTNTVFEWNTSQTGLALLCTLHHWGEGRLLRNSTDWIGIILLGLAELGITALLIIAQTPLWLALLVIFWLPGWLLFVQRQSLRPANFWWLLALLVSALAISSA